MANTAIPYEEPGVATIFIQSSFLFPLNIVGSFLDHVFYCGLVGQVLIGMAWGTPGVKLLSHCFEDMITQLGYLGLIAIVFEGGLSSYARSVQKTLFLSVCAALTGIALPIAFSFSLLALADATKLEAFAAGVSIVFYELGNDIQLAKINRLEHESPRN